LLVATGSIIAGIIVTQLNPWTGSLWMVLVPLSASPIQGIDRSVAPYIGNRPGPYSPMIWQFLVGWGLCFALGAWSWKKVKARRNASGRPRPIALGLPLDE
jgi:hypothetical protein